MQHDLQIATLTTQRLLLRPMEMGDIIEIAALRSEQEANKYLDRPATMTTDEAKIYIDKIQKGIENYLWYYWAITLCGENKLIGTICLWNINRENGDIELGYELSPVYQGRGLMIEAVIKVIEVGFQHLGYKKIVAFSHPGNQKSIRLLQTCGFIPAAGHGQHDDDLSFSLLSPFTSP